MTPVGWATFRDFCILLGCVIYRRLIEAVKFKWVMFWWILLDGWYFENLVSCLDAWYFKGSTSSWYLDEWCFDDSWWMSDILRRRYILFEWVICRWFIVFVIFWWVMFWWLLLDKLYLEDVIFCLNEWYLDDLLSSWYFDEWCFDFVTFRWMLFREQCILLGYWDDSLSLWHLDEWCFDDSCLNEWYWGALVSCLNEWYLDDSLSSWYLDGWCFDDCCCMSDM